MLLVLLKKQQTLFFFFGLYNKIVIKNNYYTDGKRYNGIVTEIIVLRIKLCEHPIGVSNDPEINSKVM